MRTNQFLITAVCDGRPLGVFDSFEGGEVDSEETKYRPGGMADEVSLGGSRTVANITIGRLNELARDNDLIRWLLSRVGRGQMVVNKQPLDVNKNPFGRPLVYTGKLKTVTPPNHDSNDNSAAVWTMVVSTEGDIG